MHQVIEISIIGIVTTIALIYLIRRVYVSFFAKKDTCSSGCGCAATDLKKQATIKK